MFSYHDARYPERRISVSRLLAAPAGVIFEVLADPAQHPLLDGSGTVLGPRGDGGRLFAGARFPMQMRVGPLPYRVTNTVLEFEEGRRIAWRHVVGHRWIWQLEPDGEATTVTETFDWSTARAPGLIERLGYPERNERGIAATLGRLEQLVTMAAEGSPAGGVRRREV